MNLDQTGLDQTGRDLTGRDLGLTAAGSSQQQGCGCGSAGGGCACSAGAHSHASASGEHTADEVHRGASSRDYLVTGMTCGHCVSSVTEELTEVDGVQSVSVDLVAGGASRVTVVSAEPLATHAVRVAVADAGYELISAVR